MYTNPNQKTFVSMKPDKVEAPYITLSEQQLTTACHIFKGRPATVIVLMYIVKNKEGYKLAFSPEACRNFTGLSINTIKRAVKDLEEHDYLIKVSANTYVCYPMPVANKEEIVELIESQIIEEDAVYDEDSSCQKMTASCQNLMASLSKNDGKLSKIGRETIYTSITSNSTSIDKNVADAPIENADADLGNSRSTSNTGKNKALKHYKSPEELPTDILQEILEGLDEHLRTGGTRGLNYKAIAKNYEIKQEYLDKDLPRWIKNILFNRECANRITNDSSTAVVQDGTSDESLSDYINEDEAHEILDTFESCGDDKRKVMHFKQVLSKKYGIPESVMKQYMTHGDFINELENIAA